MAVPFEYGRGYCPTVVTGANGVNTCVFEPVLRPRPVTLGTPVAANEGWRHLIHITLLQGESLQ